MMQAVLQAGSPAAFKADPKEVRWVGLVLQPAQCSPQLSIPLQKFELNVLK
jgi:hypothetical protein